MTGIRAAGVNDPGSALSRCPGTHAERGSRSGRGTPVERLGLGEGLERLRAIPWGGWRGGIKIALFVLRPRTMRQH